MLKFEIIKYSREYRDDMLFCYLAAKDALGRPPHLREDLLDIEGNYFDKGDGFWLAVTEQNRVVGMLGTDTVSKTDMWLKRLYVKPEIKRNGIASALLNIIFEYAKSKGVKTIHTRFGGPYTEALSFYTAQGFAEGEPVNGRRHFMATIK